jgi:hypothetical protein
VAQFPQTENDILALGRKVAAGFRKNPKVFPKPVVQPDQLDATHEKFRQAIKQARAARYAAKKATKRKKEVLKQYKAELSDALRYAESVTSSDSRKLGLIGWGARRAAKRSQPPGQVPHLDIEQEGPGWIELVWRPPNKEKGTGRVTFYEVQRTRMGKGEWAIADATPKTSTRLDNQERSVEWEYRVIAVNAQGRGMDSNVVRAVL